MPPDGHLQTPDVKFLLLAASTDMVPSIFFIGKDMDEIMGTKYDVTLVQHRCSFVRTFVWETPLSNMRDLWLLVHTACVFRGEKQEKKPLFFPVVISLQTKYGIVTVLSVYTKINTVLYVSNDTKAHDPILYPRQAYIPIREKAIESLNTRLSSPLWPNLI